MYRNYCSKHDLLLLFELFSYFLLGPPIHLLCRPAGMGAVRGCKSVIHFKDVLDQWVVMSGYDAILVPSISIRSSIFKKF